MTNLFMNFVNYLQLFDVFRGLVSWKISHTKKKLSFYFSFIPSLFILILDS